MLTVVLMSQKGGAGKSTLALHLACEGSARGSKALLLDLDPQGNLVGWAKRRGDLPPDVEDVKAPNLATVLKEAREGGYKLVVIDTAPSADRASVLAAQAADLILIPCRPAQFDLDAIDATLSLCLAMNRPCAVVMNAAPIRSRVVDEAAEVVKGRGVDVASAIIRQRVALQHCLTDGRTAAEFEPGGLAASEVAGLYDYMLTRTNGNMPTRKGA